MNGRINCLSYVMFELGNRRGNLHARAEIILNEIVLFLADGLFFSEGLLILLMLEVRAVFFSESWLILLLWEWRAMLGTCEIRSCLLHKPTSEHILVFEQRLLIVLVKRLNVVLRWSWLRSEGLLRELLLLRLLRPWGIEGGWLAINRQLLLVLVEVWRWALTRRILLSLWPLKILLRLEVRSEVWWRALEVLLLLLLLLIGEPNLCWLCRMRVIVERSLILVEVSWHRWSNWGPEKWGRLRLKGSWVRQSLGWLVKLRMTELRRSELLLLLVMNRNRLWAQSLLLVLMLRGVRVEILMGILARKTQLRRKRAMVLWRDKVILGIELRMGSLEWRRLN